MKLRTAALENYDSDEYGLKCEDKSLTQQNQAEEADINVIVARMKIGHEPQFNARVPLSGDFSEVVDFRGALHLVKEAEDAFNSLPAKVRARFENDPAQFLEFFEDPANGPEMVALGLAVPRPQEAPKEDEKAQDAPK